MTLRESTCLDLEAGEVRVAVQTSGISPGTESRCFAGKQPGAPAEGFIPGYQCVGQVSESRSALYREGDLLFCSGTGRSVLPRMWGGHTSEAVVHESKAFRLPEHAPLQTAALAKLAAIARHGLRMAAVRPGERVAVTGLGPVGFFSAAILLMRGAHPVGFDVSARRCALFEALGGRAVLVDPAAPLNDQIAAALAPDVVIDATGVPSLLNALIQSGPELPWGETLRPGLRLVVQGSYPADVVFDYDTAFTREVTLMFPRDNTPNDVRDVLAWMCDGRLRLPEGAVAAVQPEAAQTVYETLREDSCLARVFEW
ncbi:MAG: hypothetical protein JJU05_07030 [Verrucomicrobia bacterium]|nr:hypothetical protein [Verrucomicrobiota bacterium]MCH8526050.1 zinc-binding dehydrogenase [Kiritimatiellia bacterium]